MRTLMRRACKRRQPASARCQASLESNRASTHSSHLNAELPDVTHHKLEDIVARTDLRQLESAFTGGGASQIGNVRNGRHDREMSNLISLYAKLELVWELMVLISQGLAYIRIPSRLASLPPSIEYRRCLATRKMERARHGSKEVVKTRSSMVTTSQAQEAARHDEHSCSRRHACRHKAFKRIETDSMTYSRRRLNRRLQIQLFGTGVLTGRNHSCARRSASFQALQC